MATEMAAIEQARPVSYSRRRSLWGPSLAIIAFATALITVFWLHPTGAPAIGGPFNLIDARTGRQVSERDFRGKWLLVFFGYTHCPEVCPTTLSNITEAISQLGPLATRIQPLFITLDPERDTLPVLAEYAQAFDPSIIALSGGADEIAAAARAYGVYYAKRGASDDYSLDHTATIYVLRPDGAYATSLLSTADGSDIARQLRILMRGA